MRNQKIQYMTSMAILIALTIVLSLFPIKFGTFQINLAIIPIAVGACLLGPVCGLGLGIINGLLNLLDAGAFLSVNPVATVFLCLLKTGVAGLVAGLVYNLFKKLNKEEKVSIDIIGTFVACLLVPTLNTGIFVLGSWIFFAEVFGNSFMTIISVVFTTNFLIEFIGTLLLASAVYQIIKIISKKYLVKAGC